MGETYAILSNKRNAKILNYKLIKGEDIIQKPK